MVVTAVWQRGQTLSGFGDYHPVFYSLQVKAEEHHEGTWRAFAASVHQEGKQNSWCSRASVSKAKNSLKCFFKFEKIPLFSIFLMCWTFYSIYYSIQSQHYKELRVSLHINMWLFLNVDFFYHASIFKSFFKPGQRGMSRTKTACTLTGATLYTGQHNKYRFLFLLNSSIHKYLFFSKCTGHLYERLLLLLMEINCESLTLSLTSIGREINWKIE